MSTSRDLVGQLLAAGMSKADIARAVGRDSSVVSQITSGKKPYANLAPTLAALVGQKKGRPGPVPAAPRRQTAKGKQAKVRGKTNLAGGRTVRVKKQAVKNGAKSIRRKMTQAAGAGAVVAFTVTYPSWVDLGKSGRKAPPSAEGTQSVELGNGGRGFSAAAWERRVNAANGDVGKALTEWLVSNNMLDTPDVTPLAIEMRTWIPADSAADDEDEDDTREEEYDPEG